VWPRPDLVEGRTVGGEAGDGSATPSTHRMTLIVPYFSRQTSRRRPLRSLTDATGRCANMNA
jgi:hypothetical protein